MGQQKPKTLHLWLNDQRSLCDRRAEPTRASSRQEAEDSAAEFLAAPVCASCLVLIARLRRQACALLELAGGATSPDSGREAWEQLRGTRWQNELDLEHFLTQDNLDLIRLDAITQAPDPQSVTDLVKEMTLARQRNLQRWREYDPADANGDQPKDTE